MPELPVSRVAIWISLNMVTVWIMCEAIIDMNYMRSRGFRPKRWFARLVHIVLGLALGNMFLNIVTWLNYGG